MASLVLEGGGRALACRAYIQDAQIGNTELEILGGDPYAIINRCAMALELVKGVRQDIRFVYSGGLYAAYYRGEPIITGRAVLTPERAGVGWGATDTGTQLHEFTAATGG